MHNTIVFIWISSLAFSFPSLFFSSSGTLFAGNSSGSDTCQASTLDSLIATAKQYYNQSQPDSSIMMYQESLFCATHLERWDQAALCCNRLAWIYREIRDIDKAKIYQKKAQQLIKDKLNNDPALLASNNHILAIIYYESSKLLDAIALETKVLDYYIEQYGEQNERVASTLMALGNFYDQRGDQYQALNAHKKALEIRKNVLGPDHMYTGVSYLNLANVYYSLRDWELQKSYGMRALTIYEKQYGEHSYKTISAEMVVGSSLFCLREYHQSWQYYQRALEKSIKYFGESNPLTFTLYVSLSNVAFKLKEFDKVEELLAKCHEYAKNENVRTDNLFELLYITSSFYEAMGRTEEQLATLMESKNVLYQDFGPHHPYLAVVFERLGTFYLEKKNFSEASNYFEQAQRANHPAFLQETNTFTMKNAYDLNLYIQIQANFAEVLWQKYKANPHDLSVLIASNQYYKMVIQDIDYTKYSLTGDKTKLNYIDSFQFVYQKAIKTAATLFEMTQDQKYLADIFFYMEKNKLSLLVESLYDSRAKKFAGIPDTLLQDELSLLSQIRFQKSQLWSLHVSDPDSVRQKIETKISELNIEYQNYIDKIENQFPDYYHLKYQKSTPALSEIQHSLLDSATIILHYFSADSLFYILAIEQDDCHLKIVPKPSNSTLESFTTSIINMDKNAYIEIAHHLFNVLIEPVFEFCQNKKIYIIPDRELCYIPFETVLTQKVDSPSIISYADMPYLLKSHIISYFYSVALFDYIQKGHQSRMRDSFFGFAPIFNSSSVLQQYGIHDLMNTQLSLSQSQTFRSMIRSGGKLSTLLASENEINNISRLFRQNGLEADVYLDSLATEQTLKEQISKPFRYIHLASHTYQHETYPQLSGILCSLDSTSSEDGILRQTEIYSLKIQADLVVLSACESGIGKFINGEGLMALSRAFFYAGAKNVMSSMWQVIDESTAELNTYFYEYLLKGESYPVALARAKKKIIENEYFAAPQYWAPFILLGR